MLELRPYQGECLEATEKAVASGIQRPLVVIPCGGGKTVTFAHFIARRGGSAYVLAHREELLEQGARTVRAVVPDASVGILKGDRDETGAQILFASVQTLARRLERYPERPRTIVVDEAHRAVTATHRGILEHFGCFEEDGPVTLGVTATPMRADGVGLHNVFEEIVFERGILEMIAEGWLVDVRCKRVEMEGFGPGVAAKFHSQGELDAAAGRALLEAGGPSAIAKAWDLYAQDRKGIVFLPTVELADLTAEALRGIGVAAESLSGKTPAGERRDMIARLGTGETRVLTNVECLTEGTDIPSVDCVVLARPTRSQGLLTQMLGRGLRRWPGKEFCQVLDLAGATEDKDLVSVASLFGLPLSALRKGRSVTEAVRDQERAGQPMHSSGRLVAVDVDILRRRKVKWIPVGDRAFSLHVGKGLLMIEPDGPDGSVRIVFDERGKPPRTLRTAPSLELGLGIAEALVQRASPEARKLANPKAFWRRGKPTTGQIEALKRWGIPVTDGMTAGQASDLITQASTEARLRGRSRSWGAR